MTCCALTQKNPKHLNDSAVIHLCMFIRPNVFNSAPGDPTYCTVYFQPASAHLHVHYQINFKLLLPECLVRVPTMKLNIVSACYSNLSWSNQYQIKPVVI